MQRRQFGRMPGTPCPRERCQHQFFGDQESGIPARIAERDLNSPEANPLSSLVPNTLASIAPHLSNRLHSVYVTRKSTVPGWRSTKGFAEDLHGADSTSPRATINMRKCCGRPCKIIDLVRKSMELRHPRLSQSTKRRGRVLVRENAQLPICQRSFRPPPGQRLAQRACLRLDLAYFVPMTQLSGTAQPSCCREGEGRFGQVGSCTCFVQAG
jgi:hypothetical protein